MKVIERNVITGEVTERDYNQKELAAITVMKAESVRKKAIRDRELDIKTKREAAIEKILMSDNSPEAIAYRDSLNS